MGEIRGPVRETDLAKWEILVVLTAQLDGVPEALVAEHRADEHGRCLGCRLPQSGDQVWPCTLFALGIAAIEARAGRFRPRAPGEPTAVRAVPDAQPAPSAGSGRASCGQQHLRA